MQLNDEGHNPTDPAMVVKLVYRNWRGEISERLVSPRGLRFGSTDWHKEPQWLMPALDLGKGELRDFALKDIIAVGSASVPFEVPSFDDVLKRAAAGEPTARLLMDCLTDEAERYKLSMAGLYAEYAANYLRSAAEGAAVAK